MSLHKSESVSVIIPAYNGRKYICQAIKSVLDQTLSPSDFEVIVVDTKSTDDTPHIVRSMFKDKVKVIITEKRGWRSFGLNVGIRKSVGQYLSFLDQDDIYFPWKLQKQLEFMRKNPEVGMVYGPFKTASGENLEAETLENPPEFNFKSLLKKCFIPSCSVMVKRKLVLELGGFDENILGCDDWDMWIRLARICEIKKLDILTYIHRLHPESWSSTHGKLHAFYRKKVREKWSNVLGAKK